MGGRGILSQAVGGFLQSSRSTGDTEEIAEAFLGEIAAAFPHDKRQVSGRASCYRSSHVGQYRNIGPDPFLLGLNSDHAILDVLAPDNYGIAPPRARANQNLQPNTLMGSDPPRIALCLSLGICPPLEPFH